MEQIKYEQLPEVSIYAIGPEEVEYAAPLLTPEAVISIQQGESFGLALVEEGKARAAVCAGFSPENEEILEIISLYVEKEYRRRGLGTTLVLELIDSMMEATDASIRYITASYLSDDEVMEAMFSGLGFEIFSEESAISWRLPLKNLPGSTLMQTSAALPEGISLRCLNTLSKQDIRQLVQKLEEHNMDLLTCEEMEKAYGEASFVVMDEHNEPAACVIFTAADDMHIVLSQFFTIYKNPAPSMVALQEGGKVLLERFSMEAVLEIPTLTDSSSRLVQRLLPESQSFCLKQAVLDLSKK